MLIMIALIKRECLIIRIAAGGGRLVFCIQFYVTFNTHKEKLLVYSSLKA